MTAETTTETNAQAGVTHDEGGEWTTAHNHHHNHSQGRDRKSTDGHGRGGARATEGDGKWRGDGEHGAKGGDGRGGEARARPRERRERRDGKEGGDKGWGKRGDAWGSKAWIDGGEGGKRGGGESGDKSGSGRAHAREGIPTRPSGRGFTMGRGKSGGQALELSLGALQVSSVSDAFYEAVMTKKVANGQFADPEGEGEGEETAKATTETTTDDAKRYTAAELVTILRDMERANACALPEEVCGTNVPLKTIKPGDPMWELTMLGRHGDWPKKKEPKTTAQNANSKDDVPEWAQESNALADASIMDESFLGTAMPQLTEEERLGLAGLSMRAPPQEQPKTSRFVALEEEETLMPHLANIGNILPAQPPQQQAQQQQAPLQMPQIQMPPAPSPAQQQQQAQQQVPPVPAHIEWLYLDPTGQQQGPFTRQELIEWHQGGFFPNDLPCKPVDAPPSAPFMPLIQLLQSGWRYRIPMQQAPPQRQQQQQAPQPTQPQQAPPRQPPQQQGGLPPWLTQQEQPVGAAPAPRGRSLAEIEQSHGIAPNPPVQQSGAPSTAFANFAAGLGISSQAGGAPSQARGASLAAIEARHLHDHASRQEVASADATAKWDAPPSVREMPQPQQIHQQAAVTMPPREEPAVEAPKAPTGPAWGGAVPTPPPVSSGKTLLDIQREEEARAAEAAKNAPPPTMSSAFGGAWGGNGGAGSVKSLKEVQEEEARAAARRAAAAAAQQQQQHAVAQASGAWVAAAAVGSLPPKPVATPRQAMPVPRSVPAPVPKALQTVGNVVAPLTQPTAPRSESTTGAPPLNNKNALRTWCKAQMSQLNNSDDMTLVDFLLGLPSAGEVQEYVMLYLGKTPQANAFATELIRQKRADPSLAEGLGNGELSKVAAQGAGPGFAGDEEDGEDLAWSAASGKKKNRR